MPLKNPAWTADQVAVWYVQNHARIKWGALICGCTGAFMTPILAVVAVQMARVAGGWRIWSVMSLVSGALMSLFLMLPPIFWGVEAYTAPRKNPDVTALMHELASLTITTTTIGGHVFVVGFAGDEAGALNPLSLLGTGITLEGIAVGIRRHFADSLQLTEPAGRRPMLDEVFAFPEARAAYQYVLDRRHVGKVVIRTK
ncbi:hypothetical protein [Mycolicibacterium hodleri]|uniref:hypothetical protein n=1 Tax=Mycolicibacterium hodleri TaxID=49897 RepID=UPI001F276FBC|nr:hypothetical protein [Mycolicibacterium hodleri]